MGTTICLLTCALAVGQGSEWSLQPQLARGQELVYSGTFTEEALSPGVHFQRAYRVDTTILVLDAKQDKFDLAVLTVLATKDARKQPEPGNPAPTPSSVRLEVTAMDKQGKLLTTAPKLLAVPLEGPPTVECGALVEVPKFRVGLNSWWEANDEGQSPRTWRVDGTEIVNNVKCVRLVGVQQSDDWDAPRGDRTAWQRRDVVWISPQLGTACRFERTIERREAARKAVTHRSVLRCELDSGLTYLGKLLDERVSEIKQARKFWQDADGYLRDSEQHKPHLEAILKKIKQYCDPDPVGTPYRKAIVQVQKRVEATLRGETIPDPERDAAVAPVQRVAVGQRVPDFVTTDLLTHQTQRLQRLLGKPVVVMFYNPATENGRKALLLGKALAERYPDGVTLLPLAVTDDVELVQKQHKDLKLPFSILDGNGMHHTFGVDGLPRIVVVDGEGVVRAASTGWGAYTPSEVHEQVKSCLKK